MIKTPTMDDKTSGQTIKKEARDVKESINSTVKNVGSKVYHLFGTAGEEIVHAKDTVAKEIRSNPVQSTLIALGVGYVLGKLLSR